MFKKSAQNLSCKCVICCAVLCCFARGNTSPCCLIMVLISLGQQRQDLAMAASIQYHPGDKCFVSWSCLKACDVFCSNLLSCFRWVELNCSCLHDFSGFSGFDWTTKSCWGKHIQCSCQGNLYKSRNFNCKLVCVDKHSICWPTTWCFPDNWPIPQLLVVFNSKQCLWRGVPLIPTCPQFSDTYKTSIYSDKTYANK